MIARYNQREAGFGDDRLASNALVIGVEVDDAFKGYPVDEVGRVGVVNDILSGQPVVIVYDSAAHTGLALSRVVNDEVLEFYNNAKEGSELRDHNTYSLWEIQGLAVEGSFKGAKLDFVSSFISEWYGWSGYILRRIFTSQTLEGPGQIPEMKVHHVQPYGRLQSANVSCTHDNADSATSLSTPSL